MKVNIDLKKLGISTYRYLRTIVKWLKNKIASAPEFLFTTGNWLHIVGYTIAISTFWNLLGFFNPIISLDITNPNEYTDSLGIKRQRFENIKYHDITEFRNFYKTLSLPLPDISKVRTKPDILKKIFAPDIEDLQEEKHPIAINATPGGVTDIEVLRAIYTTKILDESDVEFYIDTLEKQLDRLQWRNLSFSRVIPNSILDQYKSALTRLFKEKFSKSDYYNFLCALLYSRRVENPIRITNNSNINLENIKIFVPSPESKLTGRDSCNFNGIESDLNPTIVYDIRIEENKLVIDIPVMKPSDFLQLRIVTKENAISFSNISVSYQEKPTIDKKRAWKFTIRLFLVLISLQFILHRKKTGKEDSVDKIKATTDLNKRPKRNRIKS